MLSPGRAESLSKYAELVYDLKDLGCDFYLIDHRGQGKSGRLLKDEQKGHVDKFDHFAEDLRQFISLRGLKKHYKNLYFVGHSMGAAIGMLHDIKWGKTFDKMVLSAPMVEIETGDYSHFYVKKHMEFMKLMGKGEEYAPNCGPQTLNFPFEGNRVTQSEERFKLARALEVHDPEILLGGATNNWVLESIRAGDRIFQKRRSLKNHEILMFQAGKEHYSRYERQNKICDMVEKSQKYFFKDSKHELFQEEDAIRDTVVLYTKEFLGKELF